jgi:predicted DNA-binding protein
MSDLKHRVRFSSTLPTELKDQLNRYSVRSQVPISRIIETAITIHLEDKELGKASDNKKEEHK